MNAAKKPRSLSSLAPVDPFTAEPVSQNATQTAQVRPNYPSVLTRRIHGHGGDMVSRAEGKNAQPAFFKNKSLL